MQQIFKEKLTLQKTNFELTSYPFITAKNPRIVRYGDFYFSLSFAEYI